MRNLQIIENVIGGELTISGPEGVRFDTRLKTSTWRWPNGIRSGDVFSFPS